MTAAHSTPPAPHSRFRAWRWITCSNHIGSVFVLALLATGMLTWLQVDLWLAGQLVSGIFAEPLNDIWSYGRQYPWRQIYAIASLPGLSLAGAAMFVLILGCVSPDWRKFRVYCLYLLLALALGPGLVVNGIFKDNLGRARPYELARFGGTHQYTEPWQPGEAESNSSFPSGHASVAFYLMAPSFRYHRSNPPQAFFFLVLGLLWGILVGLARMFQGGHFLTDILWSGVFVYLICAILARLFQLDRN